MDLLNDFKCELCDVLKKKALFTTEVMNLLTHVLNIEILKKKIGRECGTEKYEATAENDRN